MAEEEKIHVDEEATGSGEERVWTEEFRVAGAELVEAVKRLIHEANVRRIVIKNPEKRILLEFPLVLGVAGIALLPVWSALALIAALITDCTILVERVEKQEQASAYR